jgi:hypothetical protein
LTTPTNTDEEDSGFYGYNPDDDLDGGLGRPSASEIQSCYGE